jgi:hypothetical protein
VRDCEVEHRRVPRGRKQPFECRQVAAAKLGYRRPDLAHRVRQRDRDELALARAGRLRAVEDPLHRGAQSGREGLVEDTPVVVHVEVHDRAGAEPGERLGVDCTRWG